MQIGFLDSVDERQAEAYENSFSRRFAPEALIRLALTWCPDLEKLEGAIVAGGFIRAYYAGEEPADLDVYFIDKESYEKAIETLEKLHYWNAFQTDVAVTFFKNKKMIQLIGFYFGDPKEIIREFDYTVCSAALSCNFETNTHEVFLHKDFFEHLSGRVLHYTGGSPLPLSSLKRAFKYIKKGYHICDENIIKIAEAIGQRVNFEDEDSFQRHVAGMDPNGERRIRVID